MFKETSPSKRLEQDKKVRLHQIMELIKIFEEDQIQIDIAQQFSNQLEQAAFDLSGGDNTREYRTRLNTIKIRLNGTKGQFIRSVLLQRIMTPLELMALDMSKLNEISIQSFLEQNNRQFPYKNVSNRLVQGIVMDKDINQNTQGMQQESIDLLKINSQKEQKEQFELEHYNYLDQNKSTDLMVTQIQSEMIQKQTESLQTKSTIIETEKIDFAPQEEPISQFEEFIDYSFEYNKKQRDFFEQNDYPNIEELQINQIIQNNQQDNQFANSPLPSDNALNQEFLIDDPQDDLKENAQTRILNSQIQEEEQKYYDNECSFQAQESNLIQTKNQNEILEDLINHQLAEFATQINNQQDQQNHNQSLNMETQNIYTHQFEQQIYQKTLEQHLVEQQQIRCVSSQQQQVTEELPRNYEEFFNFIAKRDQYFENQLNQLLDQNKDLTKQFYNIQIENQVQQEILEIQNLNCQNLIQQLINENNILKLTFQQNEQKQQQLLAQLKEQQLIERTQLQNVYQSQQSNLQKNKEFLDQIEFNVDYRRDILLKLKQQNSQSFSLDDEINKIQDILVKQNKFQNNYQPILFTNEIQTINQQYYPSEIDTQTIRTIINADSGSTQIRRNREALNTEIQDEIEQYQLPNQEQSVGEINQNRVVQQQGIEYTSQIQTSLQEQTYQERDQQSQDQFKNKSVNNFKQNDQVVQSFNYSEKQDILDQQQLEQMKNNHRNKGSDIQNNQQRKEEQEISSNVHLSLFD